MSTHCPHGTIRATDTQDCRICARRDAFAAAALTGLAAHYGSGGDYIAEAKIIVALADALIAALDKAQP